MFDYSEYIEKEEVKQDEDPVEMRRKLLKQRHKAIKELIQTEKDYHRDIELCSQKILPQLMQSKVRFYLWPYKSLLENSVLLSLIHSVISSFTYGPQNIRFYVLSCCMQQLLLELYTVYLYFVNFFQ